MTLMNPSGPADARAPGASTVIPQLNSLLRGEISAAETYRMAIDKVASDSSARAGLLREIQEEHGRAAQVIRDRIRELGADAVDSSGAWGAWAKTVQATMNLFGDTSCIKALKEGEEHGLKDYNDALVALDATSQELLQNQLIPQQRRHIDLLDQMINSVGSAG
jgi:bacterioferritin (cytochrome b1)